MYALHIIQQPLAQLCDAENCEKKSMSLQQVSRDAFQFEPAYNTIYISTKGISTWYFH